MNSRSSFNRRGGGRESERMTPYELVKHRIDKTIRYYEEGNSKAAKGQQNGDEAFLDGIMSKLDKARFNSGNSSMMINPVGS